MRIAFISSEFSGLPGSGGIGTYFLNAAICMFNAGHEVEVFTSGIPGQLDRKGIIFHQLGDAASPIFAVHAADAFAARHREFPFDLLESAELKAEGLYAARKVPGVASVIRVHSPSVILNRYLDIAPSRWQLLAAAFRQARIALGAWRRGLPVLPLRLGVQPPPWFHSLENEEREVAASADVILVMNEEMRRFVRDYWWIKEKGKIVKVPNPVPASAKTPMRMAADRKNRVLGFGGRLEAAKGILELTHALEQVLPRHPEWEVRFAGKSVPSCLSGVDVSEIARDRLKAFGVRVRFLGLLSREEMDSFFNDLDLCVFPSLWESFHYVVLEAMAAGKAIVATRTGAVVDMLDGGNAGVLVDPGNVGQLVRALDSLMSDPEERRRLGDVARRRFEEKFNESSITSEILNAYCLALENRDQRITNETKP